MALTYSTYVTSLANMLVIPPTDPNYFQFISNVIDDAEQSTYRALDLLSTIVRDQSATLTANSRTFNLPQSLGRFVVTESMNYFTPSGSTNLTFVPAILFLVIEPYKKNHFVRFHSIQCLLLWVLGALVAIVLKLAGLVLFVIPVVGPLFVVLVMVLALLAAAAIWLVLVVKALQGEKFKLPLLGDFAELNADVA